MSDVHTPPFVNLTKKMAGLEALVKVENSCKLLGNLLINVILYCATIAYHMELNAFSGGRRHLANVQEK